MATRLSHNKNNSAIKRILAEAKELAADTSYEYRAGPLEDDIFEWHCTIRGPSGTEFEGGLYHCRILLPSEYPFKAPSIMIMTPNGRFELNKKICISFTSYHEELWQPAWGIRTAIIGLQGFFPLRGEAALGVGALEMPIHERQRLAKLSRDWVCPHCETSNIDILPDPPAASSNDSSSDPENVESSAVPVDSEKTEQGLSQPVIAVESPNLPLFAQIPDPNTSIDPSPTTASSMATEHDPIPTPATAPGTGDATPREPQPQPPERPVERATPPRPTTMHPQEAFIIPRPPIILDTVIFILGSLFLAILTKKLLHLFVGGAVDNFSSL